MVCMKGRGHFYEGRGMTIMTDAIRTFKLLGCELLFCTNAAGSLRPEVGAGSLVALKDHINTMPGTPMVGLNDERFGERFFSLANAYDAEYRALLQKWRKKRGPSDGGRVRLVSGAEFRDCGGNSHDANYWWGCCWYVCGA